MPLDAYSYCPAGLDKKIKFCCPDLAGDWQKIDRMMSGEQYQAALQHLDRLIAKQGDRACLLAVRCELLRNTDQAEEANRQALAFAEKFPDNPVANVELAAADIASVPRRVTAERLLRALQLSGEMVTGRVHEVITVVGQIFATAGYYHAGRSFVGIAAVLDPENEEVAELTRQIIRLPGVPLMLKDEEPIECGHEDAGHESCNEIVELISAFRYVEAEQKLLEKAAREGDTPETWNRLATLRGWLADKDGQIAAFHKLATLDLPLEDAVDAEARALLLRSDPLGDTGQILEVTYEIDDADAAYTALASSRHVLDAPVESARPDGGPPPRAAFTLFDKPRQDSKADPTTLPATLCWLHLFGRETDRPARIRASVVPDWRVDEVARVLRDITPLGNSTSAVIGSVSRTRHTLNETVVAWPGATADERKEVGSQRGWASAMRWADTPLDYLDGKTPREAAAAGAGYQIKVLAAIVVLEHWTTHFDCNRLRGELGLPVPGPIDPAELDLERLPIWRMPRVVLEKLSGDQLMAIFSDLVRMGATEPAVRFGREILARGDVGTASMRINISRIVARMASDPDEALAEIERGRALSQAAGQSCADWDLLELRVAIASGTADRAASLVSHLQTRHQREPGVMQALVEMFAEMGLINADGTPRGLPPEAAGSAGPAAEPAESGKLWTPESERPASSGKSGLWMPGMD